MKRRRPTEIGSIAADTLKGKEVTHDRLPGTKTDRLRSDTHDKDTEAKINRWLNSPELQPPR
jgi:hypothetical protein